MAKKKSSKKASRTIKRRPAQTTNAAKKDLTAQNAARTKAFTKEADGHSWISKDEEKYNRIFVPRIPTWRIRFDIALGGGILDGHFTQYWGIAEGGKTSTLYATIGSIQRTCRRCYTPIIEFRDFETGEVQTTCKCGANIRRRVILLSPEGRYDSAWAERNGVILDPECFRRGEAFSFEQVGSPLHNFISNGYIDCIAVDPVAQLQSEVTLTDSGQQARHAVGVQKLNAFILAANHKHGFNMVTEVDPDLVDLYGSVPMHVTTLYTNQLRMLVGSTRKDPATTTGGKNLTHVICTDVRFMSGKVNDGIEKKDVEHNVRKVIDVNVRRNTFGAAGGKASWRLYLDNYAGYAPGECNENEILYNIANALELIVSKGKNYTFFGRTFPNKGAVKDALHGQDLQLAMRAIIFPMKLSTTALDYHIADRFDYNPFYKLNIEHERTDGVVVLKSAELERRKPL